MAALLVGMSVLGSVLRATTHHHALAGVTFAFGALGLALGAALVCARLVAILRDASDRTRRLLAIAIAAVAFLAVAWVSLRFVRAVTHDTNPSAAAALVVDVLAFMLAVLFASRRSFVTRRVLAVVGPPLAVVIMAVGFSFLRDASLVDGIRDRAPAFAPVSDLLSGR